MSQTIPTTHSARPGRYLAEAVTGQEALTGDTGDGESALATFQVPDHADLLVVTHLLELPRDLGLPQAINYAIV